MIKDVIKKANKLALKEIKTYGEATDITLYEFTNKQGSKLAKKLGADVDIVRLCTILMDIKLFQCRKEDRIAEHIKEGLVYAEEILKESNLGKAVTEKIINAIEAHHGKVKFASLEAEIAANADCYKFLHPRGVFTYTVMLGKRFDDIGENINQVEFKMDEKWGILSLEPCKKELAKYYKQFKKLFVKAKKA